MYEVMGAPLAKLTTLRLGGPALAALYPQNETELHELAPRARELGGKLMPLGRGSNLLAADGELPVVLASMRYYDDINILDEENGKILVKAGAGAPLPRLLRFCHLHGLGGLEGLVGIPGTVGGACAMNAGSFGCEAGKLVYAADFLAADGIKTLRADQLNFSYRSLKTPLGAETPLIVSVTFALTRTPNNVIFRAMNLNLIEKKSKQPVTSWSAGCAFKNPGNGFASAGKLLEDAGFKNMKLGGMAFSPIHANFLINEGKGAASAAFDLLAMAAEKVKERFGCELELEIKVIK